MSPTLEELVARAAAYAEPIAGPSPAGAPARFEPEYQAVAAEVGKLDSPTGGAVDWKSVVRQATELLRAKSKDLVIASYLARALRSTQGIDGLATGAALLSALLERYWDTMQPDVKRLRGRANALQWFVEKSALSLQAERGAPAPLASLQALDAAAHKLSEVARARLAGATPAFGPLFEVVERLKLAAAPTAEAPPTPAAPPPAAEPIAAPQTAAPAPPAAAPAVPPAPASATEAPEFLARVGSALTEAARALREASLADPAAYRILRVGLWLHVANAPPASAGRTSVPPFAEPLRNQLALLAANQKWAEVVEESESALPRHLFALDLHRATWQALRALGAGHERAAEAVVAEVRSLLSRVPDLPSLSFSDGTPLASPPTRAWISEVVQQAAARGGGSPGPDAEDGPDLAGARRLLSEGRIAEGLRQFQGAVAAAQAGRARFRIRLELARACADAGLAALAKATYEELERDASAHGLADWEPCLVSETLKGLIRATRELVKDPRGASPQLSVHYQRLCSLDPAAAHEIWP